MSTFSSQEEQSRSLLSNPGVYIVYKVTRAGATFSLVKAALEKGMKVCVVVPTKKIAHELETKMPLLLKKIPKMMIVGPNTELCPRLDADLKLVFQLREDCSECEYRGNSAVCPFQNLLKNDFDMLSLTYDKLEALFLSESKAATIILQKLAQFDLIILDEFSAATLPRMQTIVLVTQKNKDVQTLSEELIKLFPDPNLWQLEMLSFVKKFEDVKQSGVYVNDVLQTLCCDEDHKRKLFIEGWTDIAEERLQRTRRFERDSQGARSPH
jgi:hypothetical protein